MGTPPLLCSRVQASALLNVAPSTFDKLRKAHNLLKPVRIGARILWPYRNLLAFVDELIDADDSGDDPWGRAAA
jgi:hypothetical protein